MNINKLMKELYTVIKQSGWLDKATEYFQEHPERFSDCLAIDSKIANIIMTVSYQPKSLSAVATVTPNVFISMGNITIDEREFNVYNTGTAKSSTWIDSKLVVEERTNV